MRSGCDRAGLEKQEIRSTSRVSGAGLRYLAVEHAGNQSSAKEEAEAVRLLVSEILDAGSTWIDRQGVERPVRLDDILIVAPYMRKSSSYSSSSPAQR
jgi:hypothetical protein